MINDDFDDLIYHVPKLSDKGRADLAKEARERFWEKAPEGRRRPLVAASVGPYGAARADGSFASPRNLALGGLVLVVIVALNRARSRFLRMSSIALGLAALSVFGGGDDSVATTDRRTAPHGRDRLPRK